MVLNVLIKEITVIKTIKEYIFEHFYLLFFVYTIKILLIYYIIFNYTVIF